MYREWNIVLSEDSPNSFSLKNTEGETVCMFVFFRLDNKVDLNLIVSTPELPDITEIYHDYAGRRHATIYDIRYG